MWFWWIVFLIGGYLLGSVPSAYILVKAKKGLDIRKYGSGNVGTTNTARVAGTGTGVLVFFMDALKGRYPGSPGYLCSAFPGSGRLYRAGGFFWAISIRYG